MAVVLANLGMAHQALGDLDRAEAVTKEAVALAETLGDDDGVAVSSLNLATYDLERGEARAAAEHAELTLDRALRLSYREVTAYALGIAAAIALQVGRAEDAAVLSGAFVELFRVLNTEPQWMEAERHEATLAGAGREVEVEAAVERGKALTTEEAVALARDVLAGARG